MALLRSQDFSAADMLILPKEGASTRQISDRVNDLIQGRSNATGTVTLTAGAASTTVSKTTINASAGIFLFPTTAHAAAEMGNGTLYGSVTPGGGSFTLTHANNAQTDRTFYYLVIGG